MKASYEVYGLRMYILGLFIGLVIGLLVGSGTL